MTNFFNKTGNILGMNARNLDYIARYNSRTDKKFADDKVFTKKFLSSRNIGVARLFHVTNHHTQLTDSFFESLPESFVIKPNHGLGGGGILILTQEKKHLWTTPSGNHFNLEEIRRHCLDILEGKYSISGAKDQVIFEEPLRPHPDFSRLTTAGLPDIRVIVFNKVPVMAMLRVPTAESEGKANMELGAFGMGIDIATGETTGAALFSKFLRKLPNGESAEGFKIPFWDDILLTATKIQEITKIGYLGVDLTVTKTGIKVLELNARPGLKIQIANRIPLKRRLDQVADLKVSTPADGVDIAKKLFTQKFSIQRNFKEKPVIGVLEPIIINGNPSVHVIAKIDLAAQKNTVSEKISIPTTSLLDITLQEQRLKIPVVTGHVEGADIILAGKYLGDFYIDPAKECVISAPFLHLSNEEERIKEIDKKICAIDEKIKILSAVNPLNLEEQKSIFFSQKKLSPQFIYRKKNQDFSAFRQELKKIPNIDHVLFPLFSKKIQELLARFDLLESVGSDELQGASERLFGKVSEETYGEALSFLKKNSDIKPDESPMIPFEEVLKKIQKFLKSKNLSHWKIQEVENSVADMQVTKRQVILIRDGVSLSENRLKSLIAHEIETHVFRFENGRLQPFHILSRGTDGYLQTEEGLAIYNQNRLGLNLGEKSITPALLVVAVFLAGKMGFSDLFQVLCTTYPISDELAWKLCVKVKRGLKDPKNPGAFVKDAVYFRGWSEVTNFLDQGGKISDLYLGKISVADLEILKNAKGMVKPKFLL